MLMITQQLIFDGVGMEPLFSEIENLKDSKAESGAEVIAVP